MISSLGIKSILLAIAVTLIAGFMYYQQKRLESLISENANLQLQLNVAVEANKDLNSSLCKVTEDYEKKLSSLKEMQKKKDIIKQDTDSLKRKVIKTNGEQGIVIDTANDILNRLR